MKSDIVPYEKKFSQRLGAILERIGIKIFGPQTGMELLAIVNQLDVWMEKNKDKLSEDMVTLLLGYRQRILDVCDVAAAQQGEVLKHLDKILKG